MPPTKTQIRKFLETYDNLLQFQTMFNDTRGIYALDPDNMPPFECVVVYDWLNEVSQVKERKH